VHASCLSPMPPQLSRSLRGPNRLLRRSLSRLAILPQRCSPPEGTRKRLCRTPLLRRKRTPPRRLLHLARPWTPVTRSRCCLGPRRRGHRGAHQLDTGPTAQCSSYGLSQFSPRCALLLCAQCVFHSWQHSCSCPAFTVLPFLFVASHFCRLSYIWYSGLAHRVLCQGST
jgi:hypothetical protein